MASGPVPLSEKGEALHRDSAAPAAASTHPHQVTAASGDAASAPVPVEASALTAGAAVFVVEASVFAAPEAPCAGRKVPAGVAVKSLSASVLV
jgi:hypothetical protein